MRSDRKEAELNRYLKRSEAAGPSAAPRSQPAVVTGASPQSLADVRELLGPAWTIEGENSERYEQLLVRVAEAVGPIDFIDWLLVKDIVALTWEIQRSRRQSETVIRMGRLEALKQILNQVIEGAGLRSGCSTELTELATRWLNGESRATKQVAKWLHTSGYSFADVDAHAMTVMGVELERIDLQVERNESRRDSLLRVIERRREGLAKRVHRATEDVVEAVFKEMPARDPEDTATVDDSGSGA
jgi:hypothetical protein